MSVCMRAHAGVFMPVHACAWYICIHNKLPPSRNSTTLSWLNNRWVYSTIVEYTQRRWVNSTRCWDHINVIDVISTCCWVHSSDCWVYTTRFSRSPNPNTTYVFNSAKGLRLNNFSITNIYFWDNIFSCTTCYAGTCCVNTTFYWVTQQSIGFNTIFCWITRTNIEVLCMYYVQW